MNGFAQSRLVAAALAGIAFGGIAVSQGSPPPKAPADKFGTATLPSDVRPDYRFETNANVQTGDPKAGPAVTTVNPNQYEVPLNPDGTIPEFQGSYQTTTQTPVEAYRKGGYTGLPNGPGPGSSTTGGGSSCQPPVSAEGQAPLRAGAEFNAKFNWKKAAGGSGDDNWDSAKARSMSCQQQGPLQRWSCVASAQRCPSGGIAVTPPTPACYPQVAATGGWAKLQSVAQTKARDQWQGDAGNAHGADYKWWNKARNSDVSCSNDGKKALLRQWQCRAVAEPCR